MEHGFQRTEMGRQAYSMNLAIITQAVLRTVYARVMQVLVQNRNWLAVIAAKTFPSAMVQAREVSKASVNSFGCVQKNTFGLDLILVRRSSYHPLRRNTKAYGSHTTNRTTSRSSSATRCSSSPTPS